MIQQNIEVAISAKQKIENHRSTDLDSLKIFEELTLEEMKELILYCVYPPADKDQYDPLPPKDLFPHCLAFYHSDPRDTMGAQYDTLDHLRYCVQLGTDDLRGKIVQSANRLFKNIIEDTTEKSKITNNILESLINRIHYMFDSLILSAHTLGLCFTRDNIAMDAGLIALSYLKQTPRSLSEPSDDILVDLAKRGNLKVVINIIVILSMRKSYKKAFQCLVYPTRWLKKEKISFEEFLIAPPLIDCVAHLRGNTIIVDYSDPNQPMAKKAIDWLIDVINQCHPKVQLGVAGIVKKYILGPRLSEEKMMVWVKGKGMYRGGIGPNCLLHGDEDSEKLHCAIDKIIENELINN